MVSDKIPAEKTASSEDLPTGPEGSNIDLYIDPAAEKKLLHRLDLFLAPLMILFFLVAYLDRSNIGKTLFPKAFVVGSGC